MKQPITVLIAEDLTLIRETWSRIIDDNPQFQLVGAYDNADDAIEAAMSTIPMVIIVDISRRGMNGVDATKKIAEILPETKILGISDSEQPFYATRMLKAGAMGYLTKDVSIDELLHAIIEVAEGKRYLSKEMLIKLSQEFISDESPSKLINSLSTREKQVVELIRSGHTSKEIAGALFLSEGTVQVHRHNIFKKLRVRKTAKLINLLNEHQGVA